MASIVGLCAKIVNVICFNYMVMCGEISASSPPSAPSSAFAVFYGSLIKTPYIGNSYSTLAPLFILLMSILYAVLGVFKYNSKRVQSL